MVCYWYLKDSATKTFRNAFNDFKKLTGSYKPHSMSEYGAAGVNGITNEINADGTVTHLGTSAKEYTSSTTYNAFAHEKAYYEMVNNCKGLFGTFVWQMFVHKSN